MRDFEFQAMIEGLPAPRVEREPTSDELHYLFWIEPDRKSVPAVLPPAAAREHNEGTDIYGVGVIRPGSQSVRPVDRTRDEWERLRQSTMRGDFLGADAQRAKARIEPAQPGSTRVDTSQPVSPRPDFWAAHSYRVQIENGGEWYDVGGPGAGLTANGAQKLLAQLHAVQPNIKFRIVGPGE